MSTDIADTTLRAATDDRRAGQSQERNEAVQADYVAIFNYWAESMIAERAGSRHLPKPPHAFVARFLADSSNPLAPSAYPGVDSEPGCAVPALRPTIRPTPLYIEFSYARVS